MSTERDVLERDQGEAMRCPRCGMPIDGDQAATYDDPPQHLMCPPDPVPDQNGVTFGWNCPTRGHCKQINLCLGTCKLF